MRKPLKFLHLHAPLFHARKNWGEKIDLDVKDNRAVEMWLDDEADEIVVKANNCETYIPKANVRNYSFLDGAVVAEDAPSNVIVRKPGRPKAQVGGPTDHVFGGAGAGKKND